LDIKLSSLFMHTVTTYSYFESVVTAIFLNVIASSVNFSAVNPPETIALMIRKLFIILRSGHIARYVSDLSPD
jgi:hypothetical protein